jgi:quinol monooxygenase YgiN
MNTIGNSTEIVSAIRATVRPEHRKELCLTITSLLGLIRGEEGCSDYRFYGEGGDQNSFILIGEWETRDAWDQHLNSDNFAVLVGSLRLLSNLSDVDIKLLSHAAAIEAIARARYEPLADTEVTMRIA